MLIRVSRRPRVGGQPAGVLGVPGNASRTDWADRAVRGEPHLRHRSGMLTWVEKKESTERKVRRESTLQESRGERQFAHPGGPME